jgi:DNA replication protein DnaC
VDNYCTHTYLEDPLAVLGCGQCSAEAQIGSDETRRKFEQARAAAAWRRDVPLRYVDVTIKKITDPDLLDWLATLPPSLHDLRSLLIAGPTGTGKTYAGWAVLRQLDLRAWKAVTYVDFCAQLRPSGKDPEATFERYARAPLLFLDDLGAAKGSEWVEETTYRLINRRYEAKLPGIFTTNVPLAQLREVLGERVSSRLVEMCRQVVLGGPDRRRAA